MGKRVLVHMQLTLILVINKGSLPVLVKTKLCCSCSPSSHFSNLCSVSIKENSAAWPKTSAEFNNMIKLRIALIYYFFSTGAPSEMVFSGAAGVGVLRTLPLILRTIVGSLVALLVIVTDLLIGPGRLVS